MSFYICLLLAFGLGFLLRPIFESDPAPDPYEDYYQKRFFQDSYD